MNDSTFQPIPPAIRHPRVMTVLSAAALVFLAVRIVLDAGLIRAASDVILKFTDHAPAVLEFTEETANVELSWLTVKSGIYPRNFFHPPPMVGVFWALQRLDQEQAALIWTLAMVIAAASLLWTAGLAGIEQYRWRWLVAAAAMFSVLHFVQHDLRGRNVNVVCMAFWAGAVCCAQRERWRWAGALLAMSAGVKLYCLFLAPWMIWRRQWRWFGATLMGLAVVYLAAPVMMWGWADAWRINMAWNRQMNDAGIGLGSDINNKSLISTALTLLIDPGSGPNTGIVRTFQMLWLAMIVGCFMLIGKRPIGDARLRLAMDAAVMSLAPLPLIPWFQANAGVMLLIPSVILHRLAIDARLTLGWRLMALAIPWSTIIAIEAVAGKQIRGAAILLAIFIYLMGITATAIRLGRNPTQANLVTPGTGTGSGV